MKDETDGEKIGAVLQSVESFPKTKSTIAILLAVTSCLTFLGFDVKPILKAREALTIAKIEFERSNLEIQLKKAEFDLYRGGNNNNVCPLVEDSNKETIKRIELLEEKSHYAG